MTHSDLIELREDGTFRMVVCADVFVSEVEHGTWRQASDGELLLHSPAITTDVVTDYFSVYVRSDASLLELRQRLTHALEGDSRPAYPLNEIMTRFGSDDGHQAAIRVFPSIIDAAERPRGPTSLPRSALQELVTEIDRYRQSGEGVHTWKLMPLIFGFVVFLWSEKVRVGDFRHARRELERIPFERCPGGAYCFVEAFHPTEGCHF